VENNPIFEELLKYADALQDGHFLLASGRHSRHYLQCAKLLQQPRLAEPIIDSLATQVRDLGITAILGFGETGGILAYELSRRLDARAFLGRRVPGTEHISLLPGIIPPKTGNLLLADDVTTTGSSIRELAKLVPSPDVTARGVALLATKGTTDFSGFPGRLAVGVRLAAFPIYLPADCPLCRDGVPLSNPPA